jgi:hypothetical protein
MSFLEAIGIAFDGDDLGVGRRRSNSETTHAALGNTSRHSAKLRLVVTRVLLF